MSASPARARIPVLIVGAGPVGLATAVEIGRRGVAATIVERRERGGHQPRAKTTHVRTVEHFRRWGIAEKLRAASPLPADYPTDIVFATRLNGFELAHFVNAFSGRRIRDERFSEAAQWIPQYKVEAVLREEVARHDNLALRHGVEFLGLTQTDNSVIVTLRDLVADHEFEIEADYVIGADGPRSPVRNALGIATSGEAALGRHLNVILRSPELAAANSHRRAIMYWIVNPRSPCVLAPMDTDHVWTFGSPLAPGQDTLTPAEIAQRLHAAVGAPVAFEVLTTDLWAAGRVSAESYGGGRVFLAGDACHTHPPFGGYGMNMGIADGVDIGWKVSAMLQGWGGPSLLASYETERRPVHDLVMDEAVRNYAVLSQHLVDARLEEDTDEGAAARRAVGARILETKANEFHALGVVLGVHYAGSPLVVGDGTAPPPFSTTYAPSASPGCLAPHAWLGDGSSLYDHFGPGFTLLKLGEVAGLERLEAAARERGMPFTVFAPGDARLAGLYGARLALIRPDQHVAWRGDAPPDDAGGLLDAVRGARGIN